MHPTTQKYILLLSNERGRTEMHHPHSDRLANLYAQQEAIDRLENYFTQTKEGAEHARHCLSQQVAKNTKKSIRLAAEYLLAPVGGKSLSGIKYAIWYMQQSMRLQSSEEHAFCAGYLELYSISKTHKGVTICKGT